MIARGGPSALRAEASDVAIQRINLRGLAAIHVLSRGRERFGHLRGDLERAVERGQGICEARGMNTSGVRHRQDFVHGSLDDFARVVARGELAVLDFAERRDGIQRAIPDELRPEVSNDVFRNPAGHAGTLEQVRNTLGLSVSRTNSEIASADVFYAARLRHGSTDINDGRQCLNPCGGTNLLHVVNAVLKADNERPRSEQRGDGTRRCRVVGRLHAEKNDVRSTDGIQVCGRFDLHGFLKMDRIEKQSVLLHCFDERLPANHHYRSAGTRKHPAEVTADGACSNNGNFWPIVLRRHVVMTEMRRSSSRSVLYRWGETRMLPSRRLTITFSSPSFS